MCVRHSNQYIYKYLQMKAHQHEQPQQAADYSSENRFLRQLHEERMRARQKQMHEMQDEEEIMVQKSMKKEVKQPCENESEKKNYSTIPLLMNSLFYDMRPNKPNYFIKIFSLLNDDPMKPTRAVSTNVESIFISTYGFQLDVFDRILTESQAKLYILNDSELNETKIIKNYEGMKNLTVILKSKNHKLRYGVFHTKLWLIKFRKFLRVVICTSNQHVMDWAGWLNSFWYQDFALASEDREQGYEGLRIDGFDFDQDFKQALDFTLKEMLPHGKFMEEMGLKMQEYSFKNIKVVLIPSTPGRHQGEAMERQGIRKVRKLMKRMNKMKKPIMTYQSTSLGMLDQDTIRSIYEGFCPNSDHFHPSRFRLIYPTLRYIQEETSGEAQVLFLKDENYKKSKQFSRLVLHRYDTNQNNPILGCIPHLKTVFIEEEGEEKGILLLGSHNMTKAAWGKLEKKDTQLFISNSELSLILFDVSVKDFQNWAPFKYPPSKYEEGDTPFIREKAFS